MNARSYLFHTVRLAVTAITLARPIPASAFEGPYFVYESSIKGKTFACSPTDEFVRETPTWTPGAPLPLTQEDIVKAAKVELDRHVANPSEWDFRVFDIIRFRAGGPPKWYFVVFFETPPTFKPKGTTGIQTARVIVNFRGVALPLSETK